jgi:DNA primase large subunit
MFVEVNSVLFVGSLFIFRITLKILKHSPALAALNKQLEDKGGHLMRLTIVIEHLHLGMKPLEIAPLSKSQSDYDYEKSLRFIEDARRRYYKPFKCRTIRELGFCLPDCERKRK